MATAIIIVGLPGSGKSFLIKEKFSDGSHLVLDDPKESCQIVDAIKTGRDLVISDPHLCDKQIRVAAIHRLRRRAIRSKKFTLKKILKNAGRISHSETTGGW